MHQSTKHPRSNSITKASHQLKACPNRWQSYWVHTPILVTNSSRSVALTWCRRRQCTYHQSHTGWSASACFKNNQMKDEVRIHWKTKSGRRIGNTTENDEQPINEHMTWRDAFRQCKRPSSPILREKRRLERVLSTYFTHFHLQFAGIIA